jgi:hypothetical protein
MAREEKTMLNSARRKLCSALLVVGLISAIGASSAWAAPTATTEKATEAAGTTVRLHATVSPGGILSNYLFIYGTDPNPNQMSGGTPIKKTAASTPFAVSEKVTGLTPNTTYYFTIVIAKEGTLEGAMGEVMSFTTQTESGMQFMAAEYPAEVTVSLGKSRVFEALGGIFAVECTGKQLKGTLSAASNSFSAQPSMSGCTRVGGGTVTIKPNTCKYVWDIDHNWGVYAGSFAVSCSKEGDAIELVDATAGCTFKVPQQSNASTSWTWYENTGPLNERVISLGGWAYAMKWTASGPSCSASGEDGRMGDGTTPPGEGFTGTVLQGFHSGKADEIFVTGFEP